jgi:hypothetical protein
MHPTRADRSLVYGDEVRAPGRSADTLAKEQEEAATKQDVLKALGKASASVRRKLG